MIKTTPVHLDIPTTEGQAYSLLLQGELHLLKGDLAGLELFDLAAELDPTDHQLFYRQGLALFEYGSEEGREKALLLSGKKFKTAIALAPKTFEPWHAWGNALYLLGATFREHHYFLEAEEKLKQALALSAHQPPDTLADLLWDYGVVWARIAEHSGEALDLQLALEAFQNAAGQPTSLPAEFWNDFGNACLDLATRINDTRLYVRAINSFKHAISSATSSYEGWVNLARALQLLYTNTHDEDHFSQANECFAAAAQLRPQDAKIWFDWAKFLCEAGQRNQDIKRLRSSIEKCHRSYSCDPDQPLLMGVWAEALAVLGDLSERLDLIYEAQNKISEAVESENDHPDIWYSYGICLNAFGNYFNDLDYYYQAIEKFQFGLSIDRTCNRHWHAIATTYAIIGNILSDTESFERACRFYARAIDLRPLSFYIIDAAMAYAKLGEVSHNQKWLEQAVLHFERALSIQKNAIYLHPEWLFNYACALDMLGDFYEEDSYYTRAIEILSHVLMIDPDFSNIHHHLALAFAHLGELTSENDHLYRSIHHYRLAAKHDEENDQVILDWGVALIHLAQNLQDAAEADQCYREAEHKITQSARLGNISAYYQLACIFSLLGDYEKSVRFLDKAREFSSLPPMDELLHDDWLDGLKSTFYFREFIAQLEKRPNIQS